MCGMEINGVPFHALVLHAAVVFVPLAAMSAMLMSVPRWRWLTRWPALALAVGSAVTVQVTVLSGESLMETRGLDSPLIQTHASWAERLNIAMWLFAAAVALAFWALPHVTRLVGGKDRAARVAVLEKPLTVVLPILAIVVVVLVFLTGDAGARAVWQQG